VSGTYAQDWKPSNYGGRIYYDPREELSYWADSVPQGQTMVAVPIATLRAAAAVRECRATTVSYGDEDGPMEPCTLYCRKPEGHRYSHSNGYASWDAPAGVQPEPGEHA